MTTAQTDSLLTASEVGDVFAVDAKTVVKWANRGDIPACKTPGGHWRFFRSDVDRFLLGVPE